MKHITPQPQSGFAMLFTVLLVSLILSIAIGITNLTLKQAVLSNLAKDSGIAFYQADAAVECGMFQETLGNFAVGSTNASVPGIFQCGNTLMQINPSANPTNKPDYFQYEPRSAIANKPCFTIIFDKSNPDGKYRVDGSGFNLCGDSPRRVERTLEVKY